MQFNISHRRGLQAKKTEEIKIYEKKELSNKFIYRTKTVPTKGSSTNRRSTDEQISKEKERQCCSEESSLLKSTLHHHWRRKSSVWYLHSPKTEVEEEVKDEVEEEEPKMEKNARKGRSCLYLLSLTSAKLKMKKKSSMKQDEDYKWKNDYSIWKAATAEREYRPKDVIKLLYDGRTRAAERNVLSEDYIRARKAKTDLLFGTITPEGFENVIETLNADAAHCFLDIGCGGGANCIQAIETLPKLRYAIGIEISKSRFDLACKCLSRYEKILKDRGNCIKRISSSQLPHPNMLLQVSGKLLKKQIEFHCEDIGSMIKRIGELKPTAVLMNVNFSIVPMSIALILAALPKGSRVLTFTNIENGWPQGRGAPIFAFKATHENMRYRTSWSSSYHFHSWLKIE